MDKEKTINIRNRNWVKVVAEWYPDEGPEVSVSWVFQEPHREHGLMRYTLFDGCFTIPSIELFDKACETIVYYATKLQDRIEKAALDFDESLEGWAHKIGK